MRRDSSEADANVMEAGVRVQPDADRLLNAIADDDDTEVLDAAAGCEFVDDRIRLIE